MKTNFFNHKIIKQTVKSEALATVFIFPEFWGVTTFITDVTVKFNELGYDVININLYPNGYKPESPADATAAFENLTQNLEPFFDNLNKLKENSGMSKKLIAISFSAGNIIMLKHQEKFNFFSKMISVYGRMPSNLEKMDGEILILNGLLDMSVKQSEIEFAMEKIKGPNVLVNIENAKHMFLNPLANEIAIKFSRPVEYNPDAEKRVWVEINNFLKR